MNLYFKILIYLELKDKLDDLETSIKATLNTVCFYYLPSYSQTLNNEAYTLAIKPKTGICLVRISSNLDYSFIERTSVTLASNLALGI